MPSSPLVLSAINAVIFTRFECIFSYTIQAGTVSFVDPSVMAETSLSLSSTAENVRWELTDVLNYYDDEETYSRIGLLR
jgi:hypothetical protein